MSIFDLIERANPNCYVNLDNLIDLIGQQFPCSPCDDPNNELYPLTDVWYDGEQLMCRYKKHAEAIADFFDDMYGSGFAHVGYYDPKEYADSIKIDGYIGYYYVSFN